MKILITLFFLLVPSVAFAADSVSLTKLAPKQAKVLMGADMAKIKNSVIYTEVYSFLKKNAQKGTALDFVINDPVLDIQNKVDSVLFASKAATLTPQGAKPGESIVIVSGSFDANAVIEKATAKFKASSSKKSGFSVSQFATFQLAAIDKTTLVIAENNFANAAWKTAASKVKSVTDDKQLMSLMKLADTSRGVWAVASSESLKQSSASKMNGSAMSASLKSGVNLTMVTAMTNPKDAKEGAKSIKETIKSQGGMATMVGAKPLVDNLSVNAENNNIKIKTKMTNGELKQMIKSLKNLNLQAPPTNNGAKPKPIPKAPPATKSGADADFN